MAEMARAGAGLRVILYCLEGLTVTRSGGQRLCQRVNCRYRKDMKLFYVAAPELKLNWVKPFSEPALSWRLLQLRVREGRSLSTGVPGMCEGPG